MEYWKWSDSAASQCQMEYAHQREYCTARQCVRLCAHIPTPLIFKLNSSLYSWSNHHRLLSRMDPHKTKGPPRVG